MITHFEIFIAFGFSPSMWNTAALPCGICPSEFGTMHSNTINKF